MSESSGTSASCPKCGAVLPASATSGLCPRCLMAEAMAPTQTDDNSIRSGQTLSPAELAPHFPQLEILEFLGRGGMGVVYKARQKSLNRIVALKLLAPERVADAKFAQRFTHEAQALAALSHPGIVTIYDFGEAGGFYFLLMEFVDGVNLRQAMKAGRFTPGQALAIVPPVCEALQYAHDHGIVHRDIKPENLLLDKDGRVKIADFGIAKMLGSPPAGSEVASEDRNSPARKSSLPDEPTLASIAGTPQYMAPEQEGRQRADHRADIYSLGVVLYELLTGELPAGKLQPPSFHLRGMQIDVRLDEIVLRALENTPELRYQTAAEMNTQLAAVTTTPFPVAANSGQGTQPLSKGKSRFPRLPIIVFATLYMCLVGFLIGSAQILPERVASHFDASGNANSWMSRTAYLLFIGTFPIFVGGVFAVVGLLVKVLPAEYINIPRRDLWLTPERRPILSAFLLRRLLWLACLITLFIGGLHGMTVDANLAWPPRLNAGSALGSLIGFLITLLIWVISLMMGLADPDPPKRITTQVVPEIPRFSRKAISGACWAPLIFFAMVRWTTTPMLERGHVGEPPWWVLILMIPLTLLGITAPFGTTTLGWLAVSEIRRSGGKLIGMSLALSMGLLFPLLAVDGFIVWISFLLRRLLIDFYSNPAMVGNPRMDPALSTRLANDLAHHGVSATLLTIAAVLASLVVDFLIIRAAWRRLRR